jgi:hypothetical protein
MYYNTELYLFPEELDLELELELGLELDVLELDFGAGVPDMAAVLRATSARLSAIVLT